MTAPVVVIRPTANPFCSLNHSAPSGPATMFDSPAPAVGTANNCTFAARAGPAASARTQIIAASSANAARAIDDRASPSCLMQTSWASLPGRRPGKQPDTAVTVRPADPACSA